MKYLFFLLVIGFYFFQEHSYQENLALVKEKHQQELVELDKRIKKLSTNKSNEKEDSVKKSVEFTNVILDDMQDDINLKFNQNAELNQLILKNTLKILKDKKCL